MAGIVPITVFQFGALKGLSNSFRLLAADFPLDLTPVDLNRVKAFIVGAFCLGVAIGVLIAVCVFSLEFFAARSKAAMMKGESR